MEEIFPEAVITNDEGYKMVNYDVFGILAIQAIKEQLAVIESLTRDVSRQQETIKALNDRLVNIEKMLFEK